MSKHIIMSAFNSLRLYPPYQTETNSVSGTIYKRWSTNDEEKSLIMRIEEETNGDIVTTTETYAFDLWENRVTADYIYILH